MIRDRFAEFQQLRKKHNVQLTESNNDIVISMTELASERALLELLDKIGPLYAEIKELSATVFGLRKTLHDHADRKKFANKVLDVKGQARNVFKAIEEVTRTVSDHHPLVEHVVRVHRMSLVAHFSTANTELLDIQCELHEKHKKYMKKEFKITGQQVTDEELENLLQRPVIEIFNQNVLQETQIAKQNLLDIQERHEQVLNIERSILAVNQLFQDFAMAVKAGGEQIDSIEQYVYQAKEQANAAQVELKQANVYQKKARKKKCIIAAIVFVILGIIILIIVMNVS